MRTQSSSYSFLTGKSVSWNDVIPIKPKEYQSIKFAINVKRSQEKSELARTAYYTSAYFNLSIEQMADYIKVPLPQLKRLMNGDLSADKADDIIRKLESLKRRKPSKRKNT